MSIETKLISQEWQRPKRAKETLDVCIATLYKWKTDGRIQTKRVGNCQYFAVGAFLRSLGDE